MRADVPPLSLDRCQTECIHPDAVAPLLGRLIAPDTADDLATTFATVADPSRVRLLHALSLTAELCVCDLSLLLGLSQSAVSHQLRVLRDRRVVARRKVGRVVYYRLADEHVRHVFADGLRHVTEHGEASRASAVASTVA